MSARVQWATGSARYGIEQKQGLHTIVTAVECRLAGIEPRHFALLDTGSSWSVIGGDLAEQLTGGEGLGGSSMHTRHGRIQGTLERIRVTLLAHPGHGVDLDIDASVLLARDWPGPIVLGMRGLLENLRLELDPDETAEDCWWSFGQRAR
ncbi:MAG: hypothetical protein KF729_22550 [Sandaracinaceae bacterium]|nr:hypothetical protein [Sandaracinaceae bacterium]